MSETKYTIKPTSQFKKDYKLAMKRGLKISLLDEVITLLSTLSPLPPLAKGRWLSKAKPEGSAPEGSGGSPKSPASLRKRGFRDCLFNRFFRSYYFAIGVMVTV